MKKTRFTYDNKSFSHKLSFFREKFEEIEGKVLKLLQELTSTEEKFRMFEASVTGYNEEFESFFRKSETIQRQNELIETRQANQLKLTESRLI